MTTNIKNSDFLVVNKNIINNIHLFSYEELLILLFLHTGQKSISSVRSRFDMPQSKFQKSISYLENNGFIENNNEILCLGEFCNIDALLARSGSKLSNLPLGEKQEVSSLSYAVKNYESFASNIAMPAKCRELSYMIFERLGWDTARPYDKIFNAREWVKECRQLLAVSNDDMRLIRDAIDTLKEKNYTISSPRSLFKTTSMIKDGANVSSWRNKNLDEDSSPEIY